MFKTISAALLAVSVLAAPAFAATGKTVQAPVIKATQTQTKAVPVKASVLNANARMGKHHVRHARHHNHHTKLAARRSHGKVSFRHTAHVSTKRG